MEVMKLDVIFEKVENELKLEFFKLKEIELGSVVIIEVK